MIATRKEMQFCAEYWDVIIPKMEKYSELTGKEWPRFNHEEDLGFDTIQDWYAALCTEVDKLEAAQDIIT